jgi:endonuclease/exonuclease/phosphatase family metal-dependent hydrolase
MLKTLTLNLRHNEDNWDMRLLLIAELLQDQQPDIIAFQEVWLPISQADFLAALMNRMNPAHQPYAVSTAAKTVEKSQEGIALLSRLEITDHATIALPEGGRVAQRIAVQRHGKTLHIANTHLHHRPIEDESTRLPQMKCLLEWMFAHSEGPWLLLGDMNAQPESDTLKLALEKFKSAHHEMNGLHPTTFPTPMAAKRYPADLALTLDYVLYQPAHFAVKKARVIGEHAHPDQASVYPSDHFGLMAEFELAD